MNIVVAVKLVPDTTADKRLDPASKRLVRTGTETILNPFDEYALEAALQLKEQRGGDAVVTVCAMTPESGKEALRKALAMGADEAVAVSDVGLEGSDVPGTARALAGAIKKIGFDLILCGTQSTDAGTGELPGMLAEFLGIAGVTYARKLALDGTTLRAERETENGYQRVSTTLPALASVTKAIASPRYPSLKGIMGSKKKAIASLTLGELALDRPVGQAGALTEVVAIAAPPAREKGRTLVVADGEEGASAIIAFLKEKKLL